MAKKIVFAVLTLVVFGLFLSYVDRLDTVTGVAKEILPSPAQVEAVPPKVTLPADPIDLGVPELPTEDEKPAEGTAPVFAAPVFMLDSLRSPAPADIPDYDRDAFGSGWKDPDQNGCDARNDRLRAELTEIEAREGTGGCVIVAGILDDPFTGTIITFAKADASKVHIDHMVPLSLAWKHGAADWTDERRVAFANDPINLTTVSGSANSSKGDSGPAEWMPTNSDYHCTYLTRFIQVVHTYELTIDEADKQSARRSLAACG